MPKLDYFEALKANTKQKKKLEKKFYEINSRTSTFMAEHKQLPTLKSQSNKALEERPGLIQMARKEVPVLITNLLKNEEKVTNLIEEYAGAKLPTKLKY